MKYERLTKQKWSNDIDLTQELGYSYIYKRLYALEDEIENGTLIEAPFKVGDVIYYIENVFDDSKLINKNIIRSLIINYADIYGFGCNSVWFSWSDIVSNLVFKTREQAEATLKELRGKKNEKI